MTARSATPKKEPLLTLERFLPYRLNVLAEAVSQALEPVYGERFGMTIPQWRIMAHLGEAETRTARDIAAHGLMHKSTVSRAVSGLEARKLVARQANEEDRREELLVLTAEGRRVYEALVPEALAFAERILGVLSKREQADLFDMIDRLDRHARQAMPAMGAP